MVFSEGGTYALEARLGVVLLLLVERVVDQGERGGAPTAELRLHTKDCNAVFLSLEHLRELLHDLLLRQGALFGVDDLEGLQARRLGRGGTYDLLSGEEGVPEELADVQNELRLSHIKQ